MAALNAPLERFLDSVQFEGRLALEGSVQRYGHKGNKWVWSLAKGDDVFVVAGDWSTGEKVHFGERTHGIQQAMRKISSDRAEKSEDAARRARSKWELLGDKPTGRTYLERKGVVNYGLRFNGCDVFVPMRRGGEIVGLQSIAPDGTKRFTSGCSKRGSSHRINGTGGAVLCEGYATGASIHMATGRPVVVAFDCGNLKAVSEWHQDIAYVAADNDLTPGNPGLTAAEEVARYQSCYLTVPPDGMDFNDLHQREGLDAVERKFP